MTTPTPTDEQGQGAAEPAAQPAPTEKRYPWYSLDPRALKRSKLMRAVLIGLLLACINVAPLWRLMWYYPVYSAGNFTPVKDINSVRREAWRWVTGKEIRVYQTPGIYKGSAEEIAGGARDLMSDAGLDFQVKVLPMPPAVLAAYQACLTPGVVNGRNTTCLDFAQLESRLVALRDGDPHADMLVVNAPFTSSWWAHGMACFNSGVSVLQEDNVSPHLGKHESCHLVGYMRHDDFPAFVFGYPWEGWPWSRDTLMMLLGTNSDLSPRAHDALHAFWQGMEKRMGHREPCAPAIPGERTTRDEIRAELEYTPGYHGLYESILTIGAGSPARGTVCSAHHIITDCCPRHVGEHAYETCRSGMRRTVSFFWRLRRWTSFTRSVPAWTCTTMM